MSRVTDAIHRSRGFALDGSDTPSIATEIPWDLDDESSSTSESSSPPGSPSLDLERLPDLTSVPSRGLLDVESVPPELLAPIVERMLQDGPPETRLRSVLFAAIGAEHSSSLCAATADALAGQTPGAVCLIDGNLRSPSLRVSSGVDGMPGVSDLLLERATLRACLARLSVNLWLLPAGTRCGEAVPVLLRGQMGRHLREVLETFDHVLMDTSSASLHTDAIALGTLVDGVVLVIRANATRREVAKRTIAHLHGANVKVRGAILTNRDFPIPETIYRLL